jgi:MFS family permease
MGTPAGRWVLLATVSGSGLAMLDATVVNIALPAVGRDLGTDFATLQWIVNAYTLTLASLILLAGALGDRFGRRRVFLIGVVWFALASLLCGLAPTAEVLVAARALQGIGGALLTPGSLAIISSTFATADRAKAVGAWSGLGGVAAAVGPFAGGLAGRNRLAGRVPGEPAGSRAGHRGRPGTCSGEPGHRERTRAGPGRGGAHRRRAGRGDLRPDPARRGWR